MSRTLVTLRAASADDAPFLVELWSTSLRRADVTDLVAEIEQLVKAAADSAEHRVVVADYDGQPAGAVYLRVATLTPLNLEPTVQVLSPSVVPQFRRHGIGRLLMEAAVTYAEEVGVPQVATAVSAGSRDGNRFMARLALGPLATYRSAPTAMVRARLAAQRPASVDSTGNGRQRTRVLAARRSMRRARPVVTPPPPSG